MNAPDSADQSALLYVIDEDPAYTRMLSTFLHMEGYRVTVHPEPDTAVEAVTRDRPALVILDLHVGRRQAGWSIIEGLRAAPETRDVPVILCTGDLPAITERADWMAARHCVPLGKPFDTDRLVAEIRALLSQG